MVGSRFHVADAASSQRSITVAKSSGVSGLATADALWTRRQRFRTMRACWSGGPIQLPQAPSSILGGNPFAQESFGPWPCMSSMARVAIVQPQRPWLISCAPW